MTPGIAARLGIVPATAAMATGCETTNLTKSATPATIKQEFERHSMMLNREGTYLYGIGRTDLGYGDLGDRKGLTLNVDPGAESPRLFYIAHAGYDSLFHQTDIISSDANLQPNGHYTLHCDANEETAYFRLIDLATQAVVAESAEVPIYIRPSPENRGPGFDPVLVPVRR
jgi:hypothetical protein